MARKPSALAGIFDDEPAASLETPVPAVLSKAPTGSIAATASRRSTKVPARADSHPGKKPVLIHIPEDMHRMLRQLSVEPDGEPITVVTERGLRQYLVQRGYTKFAQ